MKEVEKKKNGKTKGRLLLRFFCVAAVMLTLFAFAAGYAVNAQASKLKEPKVRRIYNTENAVVLRWSEVENADGYTVYRNTGSGWKEYATLEGAQNLKYTDSRVHTMKSYAYKVCAVKGKQQSAASKKAVIRFITPTKVKAVKGVDGGLKVLWETRSKGGYKVYRREASSEKWKCIATVRSHSVGEYTDKTVKSGKSYVYTVRRFKGSDLSAYRDSKVTKYLSKPELISVKNSPKGIALSWSAVKGADRYAVYRKIQDGDWEKILTVKGKYTATTDKNAKYGQKCFYCVRAVGGKNTSVCSQRIPVWTVDPKKKMVALTYDDGPYSDVTNGILSVLKKYNSRATFFVVGSRLDNYKDTLKAENDLGCEIGIHTYNHVILTGVSEEKIRSEINSTAKKIESITGTSPALVRTPGGAVNDKVRKNVGYPMFNWSVDTLDWKYRDADSVISRVKNSVRDGSIVLMHDLYASTGKASETIIPWLVGNGYQLVTVSEMMDARGIKLSDGGLYFSAYP